MTINGLNSGVNFKQLTAEKAELKTVTKPADAEVGKTNLLEKQPKADTFEKSAAEAEHTEGCDCPNCHIGVLRLATGILTDEQIAEINKTGRLPDNAKFIPNGFGQYCIANNFFNMRAGTQTLPEGFEVKKNVVGLAIVVPKGTDGLLIKSEK